LNKGYSLDFEEDSALFGKNKTVKY